MIIAVLYKFLFKWKSPSFATELRLDRKRGVRKDMTDVLFPPPPMLQHFLNYFKTTLHLYYMCFKEKSNRFFLCSRNTIMRLIEFAACRDAYVCSWNRGLPPICLQPLRLHRHLWFCLWGALDQLWTQVCGFVPPNMLIIVNYVSYKTLCFFVPFPFLGLKCTQFDGYIESEVFQMKALQVWPLTFCPGYRNLPYIYVPSNKHKCRISPMCSCS